MPQRPKAPPTRLSNPRQERSEDAPVVLPTLPPGDTRRALEVAIERGASPRRLAWACMAVADLLVRRMETARLLEDDRPEAIVASMRRWCLREAPDSTPEEAAAESRVALSGTPLDLSGTPADKGEKARFFFLAALDGLVDWSRRRFMESALAHVTFTSAMLDSKAVVRLTGDPNPDAEAMVFYAFTDALAAPMVERRDNPDDRMGRRTDDPVEVRPMPGESQRALEAAVERGASTRRLSWACMAVADAIVQSVERARWLEDDRPEAMISRMRRWCLRQEPDDAAREVAAEARAAREALSETSWRVGWTREEKARYCMALALEGLVAWVWQRYTGELESVTLTVSMTDAATTLRYTGETRREAEGLVAVAFSVGLAQPMAERRDNPRTRPVPTPIPLPEGFRLVRGAAAGDLFMLTLVRDGEGDAGGKYDSIAGYVKLNELPRESSAWGTCAKARAEVEALARRRRLSAVYVAGSYLDLDQPNTGLGAAMYAAAAEVAARDHHAALMSNNCASDRRKTSALAERVWKSRRFAEVAHVVGEVAYPKQAPPSPKPLWKMTRAEFEQALEDEGEVIHAGGVYRRLGPSDVPSTRVPSVDFYERDLQDTSDIVDEGTILRDYGGGRRDLDVYRAYVESADAPRPVLADQEQAREDRDDCRARQRKLGYPDEGEEGYEDCDNLAEAGYDWDELGRARSTPPAKMLAHASGSVELIDGNHRVTLWGERGFHWFPAWVLDARGHRAAVLEAVKRGDKVSPRVLSDYPDIVATGRSKRS